MEEVLFPCKCPFEEKENEEYGGMIYAQLLGNQCAEVCWKNVIGYCHYVNHPGKLTPKIMKNHGCMEKNCKYFEKFEERPYWIGLERQAQAKAKKAEKKKEIEHERARELASLEALKAMLQEFNENIGYSMYVVRIEKQQNKLQIYTVYYVSDYPFADGNRFPEFTDLMRYCFRGCRVILRHIRDVDGHFVTRDEFFRRQQALKKFS